jgi:zeaxanthin glucosyltransferase
MKQHTVVFAMLQESGHLNPTFKLARALRTRGLHVVYLAIADLEDHIRAQGFATLPFFPELFPRGTTHRAGGVLAKRRLITQRYRTMVAAQLEQLAPDLMLIDVTQTHLALWARRAGLPVVNVNTSLPQTRDPGVPPLRSANTYAVDSLGRLRNDLAWRKFLVKRAWGARVAELAGACPPYELARRAAKRFGVAGSELDCDTVYMPQLRSAAEIVLCSDALDFPRPERAGRHYVESLDLERKERDFDWSRVQQDKPLVYCALGSQLYAGAHTPAFFRRVVQVFRERSDWQLLLSLGRHMHVSELGELPPNVLAVESAPQLAVLTRARIMITHGGLGSVKECIANGVPMLVFPLDVDQPGNAARVAYHGLGLRGDVATASPAHLHAMLDRVMHEQAFSERMHAMQERLLRLEDSAPGAAAIVRLLDQGSRRSPAQTTTTSSTALDA